MVQEQIELRPQGLMVKTLNAMRLLTNVSKTWFTMTFAILTASSNASFIIDDFDSGSRFHSSSIASTSFYGDTVASVFGGTRVVQWTKRNAVVSTWGVDTSLGYLYANNGLSANVYLATYYGFGLDGGGNRNIRPSNWNFSSVTSFRIFFESASTTGFLSMRLYNGSAGLPNTYRDYGFNFSASGTAVATISLTNNVLGTSGPFDISSVDGFRVAYDTTGSEWRVSKIEAVPEPATIILPSFGLALFQLKQRARHWTWKAPWRRGNS